MNLKILISKLLHSASAKYIPKIYLTAHCLWKDGNPLPTFSLESRLCYASHCSAGLHGGFNHSGFIL